MLNVLIITNSILNVLFGVVLGLVAYGLIKNREKKPKQNTQPTYRRK